MNVRVLLVEDNPADAHLIQVLLEETRQVRVQLEHVDRLSAAIERLNRGGIEVVLLDLHLPDSTSLATLAAVNAAAPEMPVVVLTGLDDDDLGLQAIQSGAQDYMPKGVLESRLLERTIRYAQARKRVEITEGQLTLAQQIQQRLFPAAPPRYPGFEIAALCRPAEITSGDYYDYIPLPDGTLGVLIADVSGHGFGPAILMAETRAYLRMLSRVHADPGRILTLMNRILAEDTAGNQFLTLFFARLDREGPWLSYVGAGHDGFLLRPSGEILTLASTAMPLAVTRDTVYEETPITALEPGDLMLLVTDGVTDSKCATGTRYGVPRMLEELKAERHKPAAEIIEKLYRSSREFASDRPQADDKTIMVVKVL